MFARHTTKHNSRNSTGNSTHPSYVNQAQGSCTKHHLYNLSPSSYTLPPVNTLSPSYGHYVGSSPSYSSLAWFSHPESSPYLSYNRWPQSSSPTPTLSSLPTPRPLRETQDGLQPSSWPSELPNCRDASGSQHAFQHMPSPDNVGMPIFSWNIIPPPWHWISPGHSRESVGRSSNRPVGISQCTSCKVTSSPEWRKGPSGKKELCNAFVAFLIARVTCASHVLWLSCGLHYARSRRKEGHVAPTQKKDKPPTLAIKEECNRSQSAPIARSNMFNGSASFASTSSVGLATCTLRVSITPPPLSLHLHRHQVH